MIKRPQPPVKITAWKLGRNLSFRESLLMKRIDAAADL
jgi:hypothetical protein